MQDDRTYTRVLGFTELGILEMTRKRKKHSLRDVLLKECVPCKATGYVMSHETIAYELERELITYGNIEDEAVLIAAPKELQKQFLQKELQKIFHLKFISKMIISKSMLSFVLEVKKKL